jgi:hypothetical protein
MTRVSRTEAEMDPNEPAGNAIDSTITIAIAILTYRRNDVLTPCVNALLKICRRYPSAYVLVVDNNPSAEAEPVVTSLARRSGTHVLRYVHEPAPGIAAARNRAMEESRQAHLIIFIDDDERPTDRWLDELTKLYLERKPAAIAGPVVSEFAQQPDPWIVAGQFFVRRRMPTGTSIRWAATNNLLLDMAQVRRLKVRFADAYGLTGGSDTLFTKEIVRAGGTILWCDEAVVVDQVPASRLTRKWVLQKAFRLGNVTPRIDSTLAESGLTRARIRTQYAASGAARILYGTARYVFGHATGDLTHQARGARMAVRGAGITLGAMGYRYSEYSRKRLEGAMGGAAAPDVESEAETAGTKVAESGAL